MTNIGTVAGKIPSTAFTKISQDVERGATQASRPVHAAIVKLKAALGGLGGSSNTVTLSFRTVGLGIVGSQIRAVETTVTTRSWPSGAGRGRLPPQPLAAFGRVHRHRAFDGVVRDISKGSESVRKASSPIGGTLPRGSTG